MALDPFNSGHWPEGPDTWAIRCVSRDVTQAEIDESAEGALGDQATIAIAEASAAAVAAAKGAAEAAGDFAVTKVLPWLLLAGVGYLLVSRSIDKVLR